MRSRRSFIMATLVAAAAGLVALAPVVLRRRDGRLPAFGNCDPASLGLVPRDGWGARPPDTVSSDERTPYDPITNPGGWLEYNQPLEDVLHTVIVHHSALPLSDGPREIQDLHMDNRQFADVGYHYLIDEQGQLYEGRSIGVRGAHTAGHNTGAIGIVLLGNFENVQPTAAQLEQLIDLVRCLQTRYSIENLAGHRDYNPGVTLCPGAHLAPLLPVLAENLGLRFGV